MIKVSKNKKFTNVMSSNVIRVLNVMPNPTDDRHTQVEVVNVAPNGRSLMKTKRTIYKDSIRRWYQ